MRNKKRKIDAVEIASRCEASLLHLRQQADKAPNAYGRLELEKDSGKLRIIHPPYPWLKETQYKLLDILKDAFLPAPKYMFGGIPGRSIKEYAQPHVGQRWLLALDIRSFFPSTSLARVENTLCRRGFTQDAASLVGRLTTHESCLPQGAPTSPLLANVAFLPADEECLYLCQRSGQENLNYGRYVDDIAVSGQLDLRSMCQAFVDRIESTGYTVAPEKVKATPEWERQVVTGLVVNNKLRPTKSFLQDLKDDIWFCLENGAAAYAVINGLSVGKAKQKINGRVQHVERFDPDLGKKLRGRLNGIDWGGTEQEMEEAYALFLSCEDLTAATN
ncbi:MAG: reverse transcriptase family protein [Candidatus Brocadiia bacterium]